MKLWFIRYNRNKMDFTLICHIDHTFKASNHLFDKRVKRNYLWLAGQWEASILKAFLRALNASVVWLPKSASPRIVIIPKVYPVSTTYMGHAAWIIKVTSWSGINLIVLELTVVYRGQVHYDSKTIYNFLFVCGQRRFIAVKCGKYNVLRGAASGLRCIQEPNKQLLSRTFVKCWPWLISWSIFTAMEILDGPTKVWIWTMINTDHYW